MERGALRIVHKCHFWIVMGNGFGSHLNQRDGKTISIVLNTLFSLSPLSFFFCLLKPFEIRDHLKHNFKYKLKNRFYYMHSSSICVCRQFFYSTPNDYSYSLVKLVSGLFPRFNWSRKRKKKYSCWINIWTRAHNDLCSIHGKWILHVCILKKCKIYPHAYFYKWAWVLNASGAVTRSKNTGCKNVNV